MATDEDPGWARNPGAISLEAVQWGFRMMAGRDPLNQAEIDAYQAMPNLAHLRRALANGHEFQAFINSLLTAHEAWSMPLFLLRPPAVPGLAWRFAPPDLEQPGSQMCTAAQFDDPAFLEIVEAMGSRPSQSRAQWEQAWVVSVLATEGLIGPGRHGIALESRQERVASVLGARGVAVQATVAEAPRGVEARRLDLFHPEIIHIEDFDTLIGMMELPPAAVATLPAGAYDFCFSFDIPGRLASIEAALDVFEASLAPLRPGGIALHTFTLNLVSDGLTLEEPGNTLLRRRDIEALAGRVQQAGHRLLPLNTHPGLHLADETVTNAVLARPGLRQRWGMMVSTSFGLAIRKGG